MDLRKAALRSIEAVREPSDILESALSQVALSDPSQNIRSLAVAALANWLPKRPSVRRPLLEIETKDPEAGIRELARLALTETPAK